MTQSSTEIVAHTPGPWRVIDETDILALEGTPSSIVVASTKFFEGPSTSWERANARLIAAAPDLLKALIAGRATHGELCHAGKDCVFIVDANAAIAKAEGRSEP